jgi:hypothetical protein
LRSRVSRASPSRIITPRDGSTPQVTDKRRTFGFLAAAPPLCWRPHSDEIRLARGAALTRVLDQPMIYTMMAPDRRPAGAIKKAFGS